MLVVLDIYRFEWPEIFCRPDFWEGILFPVSENIFSNWGNFLRQLIALAYVVRGFHLFREGERYSQKKVAVEQSAATLFLCERGNCQLSCAYFP